MDYRRKFLQCDHGVFRVRKFFKNCRSHCVNLEKNASFYILCGLILVCNFLSFSIMGLWIGGVAGCSQHSPLLGHFFRMEVSITQKMVLTVNIHNSKFSHQSQHPHKEEVPTPFTKTVKMCLSFNFHFEKGFAPPIPILNNAWKDILSRVGSGVIDKS